MKVIDLPNGGCVLVQEPDEIEIQMASVRPIRPLRDDVAEVHTLDKYDRHD